MYTGNNKKTITDKLYCMKDVLSLILLKGNDSLKNINTLLYTYILKDV